MIVDNKKLSITNYQLSIKNMLAISLMRMGTKGKPFYRVVVKEKRSKRDGKYLENVGTYNPMADPAEVNLKHDRVQYWISVGAQPSETVASLIKNNPELSEEEKQAKLEAKNAKIEAEKQAKAEAKRKAAEEKKAEEERLAVEKAAAEKAEAEAANAESESAEPVEASAEANAETSETAEAAEEAPATEEATETKEDESAA